MFKTILHWCGRCSSFSVWHRMPRDDLQQLTIKHLFHNKNVSAANCNDSFSEAEHTQSMEENERIEITCNVEFSGKRLPVFQCFPAGELELVMNSTMSEKVVSKFTTKATPQMNNQRFTCSLQFNVTEPGYDYQWISEPINVKCKLWLIIFWY